jgi:hypothetical protein
MTTILAKVRTLRVERAQQAELTEVHFTIPADLTWPNRCVTPGASLTKKK